MDESIRMQRIATAIAESEKNSKKLEQAVNSMLKTVLMASNRQKKLIKLACCIIYRIPEEEIFSRSRRRDIVYARQLYHFIRFLVQDAGCYELAGESNLDHATIYNSCTNIFNRYDTMPDFRDKLNQILQVDNIDGLRKKFKHRK